MLGAWWANQRAVGRDAGGDAVRLSRRAQFIAGGSGAVGLALALFVWPTRMLKVWPWTLTR